MKFLSLLPLLLALLSGTAAAQSTAQNVQPGYLSTVGCPGSALSCFIPYSSVHPLPVSASASAITGVLPVVNGGTGLNAIGSANQCLQVNGAGTALTYAACSTGSVTSVTGTTNRITSTGGSTPVIDISAAYVGQTSITTLGTITSGVWNAGAVTSSGAVTGTVLTPTSTSAVGFGWFSPATNVMGLSVGSAEVARFNTTGWLGIGTNAPAAQLHLAGGATASAWLTSGIGFRSAGATYTDTSSSGAVGATAIHVLSAPIIAASSPVTFGQAATLRVTAPTAGTNVTNTRAYAVQAIGATIATTSSDAAGFFSRGTAATITGCGATMTAAGGTAGRYTSGTTGTCTVVITMNGATGLAAPTAWTCWANDLTTTLDKINQTAESSTTATLSGPTVSGDSINFGCMAY